MDKLSHAQAELREMDALAAEVSPLHRLHPLCKLLITAVYIVTLVSFPKYALFPLAVMALFPVVLYQIAGIPMRLCFRKLRFVLPLVCAVGLINPFLDHTPLFLLGNVTVTGGVVSMLTLMAKGSLALTASFLLIATTPIDSLCAALRKLHIPAILTTLLLLTYRYIGLMIEEVSVMSQAYALRAPGQRGIHISAWGSFWGSSCCGVSTARLSCITPCSCAAFRVISFTPRYRRASCRALSQLLPASRQFSSQDMWILRGFWEASL